jgi:modulator of FtsH protease HflC
VVAQAEGDAQRFRSVLTEYQKAPGVTRDRLYLETMQQVYSNVSKVMVDSRSGSNLLYLPLDKLLQQAGARCAGRPVGACRALRRRPPRPSAVDIRSRDGSRATAKARRPLKEPITMNRIGLIVAGVLLALMLAPRTLFVVDQRQVGVVYALGEIKEVITEPGLKFKLPPPFQNVVFLDKRMQTLDSPETRPIFTAEKKSLVIDWLVKWRISEPRQFIRNNGVDFRNLESRLSPVVQAPSTRRSPSARARRAATERDKVMKDVRKPPGRRGQGLRHRDRRRAHQARGLRRRHHRFGLPPHGVRAQAGGQRAALAGRGRGEKIRADADRQREVIIAEAYRDAQKIKGEGDAKASALYADAFGRDPQFAQFYRSLEAYRATFRNKSDVMVLDPSSEFFRAMRGAPAPAGRRAAERARRPTWATAARRARADAGLRGLLPFLSPGGWRQVFERAVRMSDGQIRFIGLAACCSGLLLLLVWLPESAEAPPAAGHGGAGRYNAVFNPGAFSCSLPGCCPSTSPTSCPPQARRIEGAAAAPARPRPRLRLRAGDAAAARAPGVAAVGHRARARPATFKLVDQLSGRTLGLRADTTPQAARIDAHLLNREGVTRLCYCGPVLHTRPAGLHATREPLQFGAEIFGHAGLEADLEAQELALDCLRAPVAASW